MKSSATPDTSAEELLIRERIYDTESAPDFIHREYGQRFSRQTMRKWRCVGGGPMFFRGVGGRVFYRESALRNWIESKRSPEVGSTSELPPRRGF